MDDKTHDKIINAVVRVVPPIMVALLMLRLYGCNSGDSITDCSSRNRPQHYDGSRWTCDERGQR